MSCQAKSKSMTEGPLAKQILLVSLPLALSNLLQILFNMSDVAVVGRFAGSTALGAVGSTSTFVTLFTGFLIGLSNGVNVLVARYYGARHPKDVSKTVHSALVVSLLAGILLLAVGLFGSPALLRLLNTKEDLLPGAILYLRVYFLGMPALALYNYGNAAVSYTHLPRLPARQRRICRPCRSRRSPHSRPPGQIRCGRSWSRCRPRSALWPSRPAQHLYSRPCAGCR